MKNSGSNLTGIVGLIIIFVLIFVAAYIRIPALEAFMIVIFILCFIAWLWTIFALNKISLKLKEREIHSFPGNEFTVNAETFNRKFFPVIWLKVRLAGHNLHMIDSNTACRSVTWIMPWQQLSWSWKLTALSRGVCTIDSFELQSGDGFGLSEKSLTVKYEYPLRIVVYPEIFPVNASFIKNQAKELEKSRLGFYSDRTLLKYTRPYHGFESSRDINWRSLAKGNEPEVNIYEQQSMRRVCFVPDLESFTYKEIKNVNDSSNVIIHIRRAEIEHAISVIASIIADAGGTDNIYSLAIPGYSGHDFRLITSSGGNFQTDLLSALAEIDYDGGNTSLDPALIEDGLHLLGQIFIFSYSRDTIKCRLPEHLQAKYILSSGNEDSGSEDFGNDDIYFSVSLIDRNQKCEKNYPETKAAEESVS